MIFNFGRKISFLKLRLYVKSRFVKSRLYCTLSLHINYNANLADIINPVQVERRIRRNDGRRKAMQIDDEVGETQFIGAHDERHRRGQRFRVLEGVRGKTNEMYV